jgi:hypothetical protein
MVICSSGNCFVGLLDAPSYFFQYIGVNSTSSLACTINGAVFRE